ncbi:MAG: hypothetical protein JJU00_18910 [Opitutales bacterium]|nr:hypothetical protein [Opitutales bacterium]
MDDTMIMPGQSPATMWVDPPRRGVGAYWRRCVRPVRSALAAVNLSPLRYARIGVADGGPVASMDIWPMPGGAKPLFGASVWLDPARLPPPVENTIYSNADGYGMDASRMVARFKAISEAMERWAFRVKGEEADRVHYGFDIDPTSNGMSAFPGLVPWRARDRAELEALERFVLFSWWEGRLDAVGRASPWADVRVLELEHGLGPFSVAVVYRDLPDSGLRLYGHGAGATLAEATAGAYDEMLSHGTAVATFERRGGFAAKEKVDALENTFERRAMFFATKAGQRLFEERLAARRWAGPRRPKVVFNGIVPGEWNRYAHVWRVTFEPVSTQYLNPRINYFFW